MFFGNFNGNMSKTLILQNLAQRSSFQLLTIGRQNVLIILGNLVQVFF